MAALIVGKSDGSLRGGTCAAATARGAPGRDRRRAGSGASARPTAAGCRGNSAGRARCAPKMETNHFDRIVAYDYLFFGSAKIQKNHQTTKDIKDNFDN